MQEVVSYVEKGSRRGPRRKMNCLADLTLNMMVELQDSVGSSI